MRLTMVSFALRGWLITCGAIGADGVAEMGLRADLLEARVLNVLNYGAVGDDRTDNTESFSAEAYNDIEHPERVVPERRELKFRDGVNKLPPHSLSIVKVPVN